jgi:hypothetical protein
VYFTRENFQNLRQKRKRALWMRHQVFSLENRQSTIKIEEFFRFGKSRPWGLKRQRYAVRNSYQFKCFFSICTGKFCPDWTWTWARVNWNDFLMRQTLTAMAKSATKNLYYSWLENKGTSSEMGGTENHSKDGLKLRDKNKDQGWDSPRLKLCNLFLWLALSNENSARRENCDSRAWWISAQTQN